ncbi:MAG: glycerol-3-phosphate dehydrogenase/oxidase [Planctomycetota bacterium]
MFDVIVIGGGINGTGVARDCAMRGLSVLLLEKRDFGVGATGNSSGMIHGGLRYLLDDATVTRKSCEDSGYIQRIAPHLLFRIPLLVPQPGRGLRAWWRLELVEAYLETYDRFVHLKNGMPHTRLTREEACALVPGLVTDIAGAVTTDEWGIDPYRLCVANALSAARHGAQVRLGAEVVGFLRDGAAVCGVVVRDAATGGKEEVRARAVVNATGPWLMKTARVAGVQAEIRPAKGVHIVLDRRIAPCGVVVNAIDGRQIFVLPYDNVSLIGTTDDDYYGDLDDIPILADEVEYLLQGIEHAIPDIRKYRRIRATAGLRPTIHKWGVNEDDLSRDHVIIDHGRRDGSPGLWTVLGGKLAAYRLMSEEAADAVCAALGNREPCRTHQVPLPGGEAKYDVADAARRYGWPLWSVERLASRHGTRAELVLRLAKDNPGWRRTLCDCEGVTEAEVRFVVREEWARSLGDVGRRTRLGFGPCAGQRCAREAAEIVAEERGLDPWAPADLVRDFEQDTLHARQAAVHQT